MIPLKRTTSPYVPNVYIVKQYGSYHQKIINLKACRESGWEDDSNDGKTYTPKSSVNDEKLDNNICRARSTVRELVLCNEWDWWVTLTLDKTKYNRYDLDTFKADWKEFIHNYNRRCSSENDKVRYLLVPEMHEDGAWHMHGFLKGVRSKDMYVNQYGYLSWKQYGAKFGFISIGTIQDVARASSYICKYITKDIDKNETRQGKHMYICSRNLKRAEILYRGSGSFTGAWDWEHEDGLVKTKMIDMRQNDIHDIFTPDL